MNNGKLCTLYVLPSQANGEFDNYERVVWSAPYDLCRFVVVSNPAEPLHVSETQWWGLIYGNEWFDPALAKALTVYLTCAPFDCLVLFKRVKVNDVERFYVEPRIFKSSRIEPKIKPSIDDLSMTKVLDGFILEDDRIVEVSHA